MSDIPEFGVYKGMLEPYEEPASKYIKWSASEDGWFVCDESEKTIGFCSTYTEALDIFEKGGLGNV